MKYPLIDYCPNPKEDSSIIDQLLSNSYSKIITKDEVVSKLTKTIKQSSMIEDILSVTAMSTSIESNHSFSITLISGDITEYNPTSNKDSGGYYDSLTNKLVVTVVSRF